MPSRARAAVWVLLGLTAAFALGTIALQLRVRSTPPLQKFQVVPDFQLTDHHGQPVRLADLIGKVWLADFIYTTCPGPCPVLTTRLADLQKDALKNPGVRFVSISTNPAEDTPEVLQKYADRFHASDQWLFLTGDKTKVFDLIQKGFLLSVIEQADAKNPVIHSTKLALVDKNGIVRRYFDGQNGEPNDEILRAIDQLLRE